MVVLQRDVIRESRPWEHLEGKLPDNNIHMASISSRQKSCRSRYVLAWYTSEPGRILVVICNIT